MFDNELEIPASEVLLAEIGLNAHTIREILSDAAPALKWTCTAKVESYLLT